MASEDQRRQQRGLNPAPMHIAYIVHDLTDPAVLRRVRMFHAGGATVTVLGFSRRADPPASLDGAPAILLGLTADGRLGQRLLAVARRMLASGPITSALSTADVVVARNLECLALAVRTAGSRRTVYECLDIHRTLIEDGFVPRLIQRAESWLLRRAALIVTSSPRFSSEHFDKGPGRDIPKLLIENKVLLPEPLPQASQRAAPSAGGPDAPWTIGWFGMIRCRRSFTMLADLVARSDGRLRVLIAGIASPDIFPDFEREVAAVPGMTFAGRYAAQAIGTLYGRVHFAWAIDYFEEGLNSSWLLPNRLYESLCFGAVPIALETVETGAWLSRHGAGVVMRDPLREVPRLLETLDAPGYARLVAASAAVPRDAVVMDADECRRLTARIVGAD